MFIFCLFISGSTTEDEVHNANADCTICKAWSKKTGNKEI